MLEPQLTSKLLVETSILDRIKIDNFLLVLAGARHCSQVTFPAELPGGRAMVSTIDNIIAPKMAVLRSERNTRKRIGAIESLKKEMAAAYEKIVMDSPQYRAHERWIKSLRLRSRFVDVRPTIQELYIFRDRRVGGKLKILMKERERLRKKAYQDASHDRKIRLVYPEEFDSPWLREMGILLGYPGCCVDAYASDRSRGINVETRASKQLKDAERKNTINPYVYFVGYFFPCLPWCENALELGLMCQDSLNDLAPAFGGIYPSVVAANMVRVRRQPEVIAEYEERARNLRFRQRYKAN